jgi:hypothetical protein
MVQIKRLNHWPLGIATIYILFIFILLGIFIFSTFNKDDLVAEDYYDQEIKYQQQIERIKRADSLSQSVYWTLAENKKWIMIKFPKDIEANEINGNILFFRPSDAKQDKLIALQLSPENIQIVSTQNLRPGLWKIKIFWQINQKDFYMEGKLVI